MSNVTELRRRIPSADKLLDTLLGAPVGEGLRHDIAVALVREFQEHVRTQIADNSRLPTTLDAGHLHAELLRFADERLGGSLRQVINATGVVLHTNLGRAVLAPEVIRAMTATAAGAVNIEYDLRTGARGHRDEHVEGLLTLLTGAEAATAVNNNAAAVLLMLSALCAGREVIVSRGEQVEIGGAFRIPDILRQSGATLIEVGTTNCTYLRDYTDAVTDNTAAILKVHTSNYTIEGHTANVGAQALRTLADDAHVLLLEDLGSGSLIDLAAYGLPHEPVVREEILAGADLVTFSGDKLLGGPQAGCIVGRRDLLDAVNRHPLKRAVRLDKVMLAGLASTLALYLREDAPASALPTLAFLTRPQNDILVTAERVCSILGNIFGNAVHVTVAACRSEPGSGSYPGVTLPSHCVHLRSERYSAQQLHRHFLAHEPAIIGRIHDDALVFDMRTILEPSPFESVAPLS